MQCSAATSGTSQQHAHDALKQQQQQNSPAGFRYEQYRDERDLPTVSDLIDNELSEPYSIFTYRYFLHRWPHLCYIAYDSDKPFGVIVCKLDDHRGVMRGYIAMLVVLKEYRGYGVGSQLVRMAINEMIARGAAEVALEAELTNTGAIRLYQKLGFIRDKRLSKYYLNGADAYRLKLLLPPQSSSIAALQHALELSSLAE